MSFLTLGCAHEVCNDDGTPELSGGTLLTYYDFYASSPPHGYCEQQVFGKRPVAAEPVNMFFAFTTFILGLFGVMWSKRTTLAFQFLYGLLAAYGLFATSYHVTLNNGLYRMMDVTGGIIQSFIIIMLFHSLYLYHVKSAEPGRKLYRYRIFTNLMTMIFTIYPAAVHVAGESSGNPWVAWLVFDLLWILIAVQLILIWVRRKRWPKTPPSDRVFHLVWYAIATACAAYAGWCIDKFICTCDTPALAWLSFHGFWHLFMGLCFYYMITLNRYFSAHEYGFEPRLDRIPHPRFGLTFVEWKSRNR